MGGVSSFVEIKKYYIIKQSGFSLDLNVNDRLWSL